MADLGEGPSSLVLGKNRNRRTKKSRQGKQKKPFPVSSRSGSATAADQNLKLFLLPKRLVIEGQVSSLTDCKTLTLLTPFAFDLRQSFEAE